MARKAVDKPHNGGQWTPARFRSFIKGALRSATRRWGPIHAKKKAARVDRGVYRCAGHKRKPHDVRLTVDGKKNVFVDHIDPVVGPEGFTSWDLVIERMFVEEDKLQVLCRECHDKKSKEERKAYYDYKRGSN